MADDIDSLLAKYAPAAAPAAKAPAQAASAKPDDVDALLAKYAPTLAPDAAPLPEAPKPGLWDRVKNTASNIKDTVVGGAKAVGEIASDVRNVPGNFVSAVKDPAAFVRGDFSESPARRRQLERGIDDMATLGYGQKLAARAGNALGDAPTTAVGPETFGGGTPNSLGNGGAPVPNTQAADTQAAPEFRQLGNLAGMALPGATSALGKGGAALADVIPGIQGASAAAKAAKGVIGYEAAAVPQAALAAGAEGHRAQTAYDAATDPVNLGLAAGVAPLAESASGGVKKIIEKAPENTKAWITRSFVGDVRGASTSTAKDQLARAQDTLAEIVPKDKPLYKALQRAEGGDKEAIIEARSAVQDRIDQLNGKTKPDANAPTDYEKLNGVEPKPDGTVRADLYTKMDKALPKPITSGDYVNHLSGEIDKLKATGFESDRTIADHLQKTIDTIKDSRDWGGRSPIFDPTVKIGDSSAGDLVTQYEKARTNAKTDAQKGALQDAIDQVKQSATKTGFDPDHVVSAIQVRDKTSDVQKSAYEREGGLNGTERYNRGVEVASHSEDFLQQLKDQAAKKDPAAIKAIDKYDDTYSALKRAKTVLDQRLNRATQDAMGASVPAHGVGKFLYKATKHPVNAALSLAPEALLGAKRAVDERTASLVRAAQAGHLGAQRVLKGLQANVVTPVARGIATHVGPQASIGARDMIAAQKPNGDDLLAQLVTKADAGDPNAQAKLNTLSRNPIIAARVSALRRRLSPSANLQ